MLIDLTYTMTALGFISFNFITITGHINKGTITMYFRSFTNGTFLITILYLGLLSSLLMALLLNYSLSYIEAAKFSVFSNLSTLITIMAGVIFIHEQISDYHVIDTIMIVLGVMGTNFPGKKGVIVKKKNISMNK